MPSSTEGITPHRPLTVTPNTSVRLIYIDNLVNLLHTCLLRNKLDQARRAWAILVRCREFDWKSRWYWGLLLLEHTLDISPEQGNSQTIPSTYSHSHTPELWLRDLQTRLMGEVDRPAILHARILYMIKHNQHRQALSELDLWLASYPYATSGPLHTYAGLLCFYLSQPEHTRPLTERQGTEESSDYQETKHGFQVDKTLLRESRNWFQKALEIDKNDQVALDFIHLIDDSVDGHGEYSTNGYKDRKSDESDASDRDSIISSLGSDL